ncbi:hypothetical protein ACJ72_08343, partial [Emergomyces africanus]
QWGPIVGAGLAVLGSLYLVLAADLDAVEEEDQPKASSNQDNNSMREINTIASAESSHSPVRDAEMRRSVSHTRSVQDGQPRQPLAGDSGNRRKVARALTKFVIYLSDAAHERLNDSEFKSGKAQDFPEIPGEIRRNRALPHIRNQYNTYRENEGNVTPSLRGRASRANSFTSSIYGLDVETGPRTAREYDIGRAAPPEIQNRPAASSGAVNGTITQRRATLEVPAQTHHSSPRNHSPASPTSPTHSSRSIPDSRRPPAIVVSSENEDTTSPVYRATSHPVPSPSSPSSGPISTPPVAASPSSPRHMRQFTL